MLVQNSARLHMKIRLWLLNLIQEVDEYRIGHKTTCLTIRHIPPLSPGPKSFWLTRSLTFLSEKRILYVFLLFLKNLMTARPREGAPGSLIPWPSTSSSLQQELKYQLTSSFTWSASPAPRHFPQWPTPAYPHTSPKNCSGSASQMTETWQRLTAWRVVSRISCLLSAGVPPLLVPGIANLPPPNSPIPPTISVALSKLLYNFILVIWNPEECAGL